MKNTQLANKPIAWITMMIAVCILAACGVSDNGRLKPTRTSGGLVPGAGSSKTKDKDQSQKDPAVLAREQLSRALHQAQEIFNQSYLKMAENRKSFQVPAALPKSFFKSVYNRLRVHGFYHQQFKVHWDDCPNYTSELIESDGGYDLKIGRCGDQRLQALRLDINEDKLVLRAKPAQFQDVLGKAAAMFSTQDIVCEFNLHAKRRIIEKLQCTGLAYAVGTDSATGEPVYTKIEKFDFTRHGQAELVMALQNYKGASAIHNEKIEFTVPLTGKIRMIETQADMMDKPDQQVQSK